ncbi:hypothetical protein E2C01_006462 [Portunus trituberculatus]|uniref:Uncharacterized protein n=1 Tax=Portunus trituberculatus TaxID=210409 RepID=A0A5B7CWX9_PORTR|nr:hypothetical protein [Portunus trituberculatus]
MNHFHDPLWVKYFYAASGMAINSCLECNKKAFIEVPHVCGGLALYTLLIVPDAGTGIVGCVSLDCHLFFPLLAAHHHHSLTCSIINSQQRATTNRHFLR